MKLSLESPTCTEYRCDGQQHETPRCLNCGVSFFEHPGNEKQVGRHMKHSNNLRDAARLYEAAIFIAAMGEVFPESTLTIAAEMLRENLRFERDEDDDDKNSNDVQHAIIRFLEGEGANDRRRESHMSLTGTPLCGAKEGKTTTSPRAVSCWRCREEYERRKEVQSRRCALLHADVEHGGSK